jgi:hypothetical protein
MLLTKPGLVRYVICPFVVAGPRIGMRSEDPAAAGSDAS